jgi:hypothetical protein
MSSVITRYAEITTDLDTDELHQWATQLTDDYLPDEWETVSASGSTRVAVNRARGLHYKEYLPRSPAAALKARVTGSRAERARSNNDALLLAGIDAPRNIHWGKLPQGREYLFMETVPGLGINRWLSETSAEKRGEALRVRRQLLHAL